jgi:glycosyltransferase involved in cell wall biosynthesis
VAGEPRVGVLVVAYNAASTLEQTLDRLPGEFAARVDHILICDDASSDDTYEIGVRYKEQSSLPLTVVKHAFNLGYGGNQKVGYRWAIDHGLDIVVLLHGDGQYAPEIIDDLVGPVLRGEADAVLGSRMMERGRALAGGMPAYKYVGNKILTTVQNRVVGTRLSEWHSGYRAYRTDALSDIDFASYSDGFNFDTQIILGLHDVGKKIVEVPIPTYYGDEICYVNGLRYARDVVGDVLRYKARRVGFGSDEPSEPDLEAYDLKPTPHSSHGRLLAWLSGRKPARVLDVGCSDGRFGALVRGQGHHVDGLDVVKHPGIATRLDGFVEADLEQGLPPGLGRYDVVVAGDVLEHVTDPERLLGQLRDHLEPGGEILVSVPNFAHWYPRARVVTGHFDYDHRGLLDRGHVRFFTRRTFERLVRDGRLRVVERETVGTPFEILDRGGSSPLGSVARWAGAVDRAAVRVWPTLFGYQFIYRLVPA